MSPYSLNIYAEKRNITNTPEVARVLQSDRSRVLPHLPTPFITAVLNFVLMTSLLFIVGVCVRGAITIMSMFR